MSRATRRGLVACLVIGVLHAMAWAVLTPAFEGRDEIAQVDYVEEVAQTGRPPSGAAVATVTPPDVRAAIIGIPWTLTDDPRWSPTASAWLDDRLDGIDRTVVPGQAGYQASNPPLYAYTLVPVNLATNAVGGNVLDRILAMRLFSALYMVAVVGGVFLFVRELLPGRPLAPVVAGLVVALQPMLAATIGTVNNDAPVFGAGAVCFWLLARAFRRGMTPRIAAGIGTALVVALLSKVSSYGLIVGTAWALFVLVVARRDEWRRTLLPLAGVAAALLVAFVALRLRTVEAVALPEGFVGQGIPEARRSPFELGAFASYVWQFWLPRLWFMEDRFFPGYYPLWFTVLQSVTGRFGQFQWGFGPGGARLLVGAIVVSAVGVLAYARRHLAGVRRRAPELAAYAGLAALFALSVNYAGYDYERAVGAGFEQGRYFFPLLGLYGALAGVGVIGYGRRAHLVAALLVTAASVHVLAAFALLLQRYYT